MSKGKPRIIYVVTEDWYFCSHRLPLARAARNEGFEVLVVTRFDRDKSRILKEGFRVFDLDMKRGRLAPLHAIRVVVQLVRIFARERPVIVHNVAMKPVVLGTIAARFAGIHGVVNALAGLGYVFTSKKMKALVLKRIIKIFFRVLFSSSAVRLIVQNSTDFEVIQNLGVSHSRISLIAGSGVDTGIFRPTPEMGGPIVVVMVSRMLWDKGVGDLVEAAQILRKTDVGCVIRLVGPTDPQNPSSIPESTLNQWVEDKIVEWSGLVDDIVTLWKNAHIAVLPSYREGLPKSLLEAGASGRPLIGTDVPGCREIIVNEETGLLVKPNEPQELADAIVRLANNSDLRRQLGRAARTRVETFFSIERVVQQTIGLYRSLLRAEFI